MIRDWDDGFVFAHTTDPLITPEALGLDPNPILDRSLRHQYAKQYGESLLGSFRDPRLVL